MSQAVNAILGLLLLIIIPLGIWRFIEMVYYGIKAFREGRFRGRFRFRQVHKSISNRELKKRIKNAKRGKK